jgi:hypothetical protein
MSCHFVSVTIGQREKTEQARFATMWMLRSRAVLFKCISPNPAKGSKKTELKKEHKKIVNMYENY